MKVTNFRDDSAHAERSRLFAPSECVYEIASMKALHLASGTPSHPMRKSIASPLTSRWLIAGGAAGALALAGTLSLWAHFGTVVFFETIRTGFVACFG
jgi:hypothetical protein